MAFLKIALLHFLYYIYPLYSFLPQEKSGKLCPHVALLVRSVLREREREIRCMATKEGAGPAVVHSTSLSFPLLSLSL